MSRTDGIPTVLEGLSVKECYNIQNNQLVVKFDKGNLFMSYGTPIVWKPYGDKLVFFVEDNGSPWFDYSPTTKRWTSEFLKCANSKATMLNMMKENLCCTIDAVPEEYKEEYSKLLKRAEDEELIDSNSMLDILGRLPVLQAIGILQTMLEERGIYDY